MTALSAGETSGQASLAGHGFASQISSTKPRIGVRSSPKGSRPVTIS